MKDVITRVREFYDRANEPLRRRLHAFLAAVVLAAATGGLITGEVAVAVTGVVTAALAVPAVESARSRVSPTPVYDEPGRHAEDRGR